MSLIKCPECGGSVSSCAAACPHCGFPVASPEQNVLKPDKMFRLCCVRIDDMQIVQQHFNEIAALLDLDVSTLREELTHRGCILADHISRIRAEELQQILNKYSITTMIRNIDVDSRPRTYSAAADTRPQCPRCGSTQITTGQRGWKLTTGFLGSSKTVNRCANCGYKWEPSYWTRNR